MAAVIEHQGRFLLVEEQTPEGLMLNNPAGHLEAGESPEQGVVREVMEETGCVMTPQAIVGIYLSRFHRLSTHEDITYMRLAFCGKVSEPTPGWVLDEGIVRTLWLTPAEIRASAARHRSPLVLQCMENYLAGQRYPLNLVQTDASVYSPDIKRPT